MLCLAVSVPVPQTPKRRARAREPERTDLTLDYTPGCRLLKRSQSNADRQRRKEDRPQRRCDSFLRAKFLAAAGTKDGRRIPSVWRRRLGDSSFHTPRAGIGIQTQRNSRSLRSAEKPFATVCTGAA